MSIVFFFHVVKSRNKKIFILALRFGDCWVERVSEVKLGDFWNIFLVDLFSLRSRENR